MIWFDYSLLKYLPDPKRGEVINIGLIVFRNSGVDVRLLKNTTKVRVFDGVTSINELSRLKASIEDLCGKDVSAQVQHQRLKMLGTGIFTSGLSAFSIENISNYEKTVSGLFHQLVSPYSPREPRRPNSRLFTKLKNEFKALDILAKELSDIEQHKVVPSYLIDANTGLEADFMLKNGKFHMTEVVDFNVEDVQRKFRETSLKTMTFITGKRVIESNMGCYFLYSASTSKEQEIISHLNLAEANCDKMFNIESSSEKADYYQMLSDLIGNELPLAIN